MREYACGKANSTLHCILLLVAHCGSQPTHHFLLPDPMYTSRTTTKDSGRLQPKYIGQAGLFFSLRSTSSLGGFSFALRGRGQLALKYPRI